jgi:hypothetical protein
VTEVACATPSQVLAFPLGRSETSYLHTFYQSLSQWLPALRYSIMLYKTQNVELRRKAKNFIQRHHDLLSFAWCNSY